MASTSASGSLATARPNARSLRASAWRVEKAALLSQGGPSRRARSARGAGASRGRTGAVVVKAKIWTDDGRRRAAELMGLTREVRPSRAPRGVPPASSLFSRGRFFQTARSPAFLTVSGRFKRAPKISRATLARRRVRARVVAAASARHRAAPRDASRLTSCLSPRTRVARRKLPTANA